MPALEEDRDIGAHGETLRLCDSGVPVLGDRGVDEHRELRQVRGDEVGESAQVADGRLGIGVEKPVAARRDHHGIEHDDSRPHVGEPRGHDRDDLGRPEHPDLDRVDLDVVAHRTQLRRQELRRRYVHPADAEGVLRDERGHGRHAVPAERRDALQIRLDAGTTGRVGPGDAQHAGDHAHASRNARVAADGSSAPLTAETTATPAAPARRRGATSPTSIPPIATQGRGV